MPAGVPYVKLENLKKRRRASSIFGFVFTNTYILPGILCRGIGIGLQDEIKVELHLRNVFRIGVVLEPAPDGHLVLLYHNKDRNFDLFQSYFETRIWIVKNDRFEDVFSNSVRSDSHVVHRGQDTQLPAVAFLIADKCSYNLTALHPEVNGLPWLHASKFPD